MFRNGSPHTLLWEYKMVQLLWQCGGSSKTKVEIPYDPAISQCFFTHFQTNSVYSKRIVWKQHILWTEVVRKSRKMSSKLHRWHTTKIETWLKYSQISFGIFGPWRTLMTVQMENFSFLILKYWYVF
jgi:hypothetical protein